MNEWVKVRAIWPEKEEIQDDLLRSFPRFLTAFMITISDDHEEENEGAKSRRSRSKRSSVMIRERVLLLFLTGNSDQQQQTQRNHHHPLDDDDQKECIPPLPLPNIIKGDQEQRQYLQFPEGIDEARIGMDCRVEEDHKREWWWWWWWWRRRWWKEIERG